MNEILSTSERWYGMLDDCLNAVWTKEKRKMFLVPSSSNIHLGTEKLNGYAARNSP